MSSVNYTTKSFDINDLISLTQNSAKELKERILSQGDICPLCNKKISKPVLDHQHMTSRENIGENGAGLVRGVICNNCNIFLGKIENNSKRFLVEDLILFLNNVCEYLKRDNMPYIHPNETKRLRVKLKKSIYNKIIKEVSNKSGKPRDLLEKKYKYNNYYNKSLNDLIKKYSINIGGINE